MWVFLAFLVSLGLCAGASRDSLWEKLFSTDSHSVQQSSTSYWPRWSELLQTLKSNIHKLTHDTPYLYDPVPFRANSRARHRMQNSVVPTRRLQKDNLLPDEPPTFIDVTLGSMTTAYRGNWSIAQGNSGSLRLYNPSPARSDGGMMLASIFDLTWTPEYYTDKKDSGELVTATRNISAIVNLMNGSYINSAAYHFVGYGFYSPQMRRGIVKLLIPSLSKQPSLDLNQSAIEQLFNSTDWPSYVITDGDFGKNMTLGNCTIQDPSTLDRANTCDYYLFFSIKNGTRTIKDHVYPPDYAAQIQKEGVPIQDNPTEELVPLLEYRLYSATCCVDIQTRSLLYNFAQEMTQAMVYGGTVALLAIITAVLCAHSLTKLISPVRLSQLAMTSIIMQTTIDALIAINGVNYAFEFQASLGPLLLTAVAFFIICLIIDIQLLMLKQRQIMVDRNRGPNPQMGVKIYCIFYLVMLGSMIISSYIPFRFLFYFFLFLSSYWVPQCYYMCKVRSPTPGYTYTYVIFVTVLRTIPIWYFYCYSSNFLGYETVSFYQYFLFAWVMMQLICMLGLMLTSKTRYKIFLSKESHSIYTYTKQLLSQHVISNFEYFTNVESQLKEGEAPSEFLARLEHESAQSFPFVVKYFHKPNSIIKVSSSQASVTVLPTDEEMCLENEFYHKHCMNPLHKHSTLYAEAMTLADLASCNAHLKDRLACQSTLLHTDAKDPDAKLTNCFYMVRMKDITECVNCSICLDYIELTPRHINLFQIPLSKEYDLDLQATKSILEEINATGKLSSEDGGSQQKASSQQLERELWITPCGHTFHASCLRRWMDETLQCPVDRASLPLPSY